MPAPRRPAGHRHAPGSGPTAAALVERLRAAGARVTTARRLVLDELVAAGGEHLTAEGIAQRVQRTSPEVHTSTVYRTLEAFEQLGLVVPAGVHHGAMAYHLADDRHHHAVCDRCGAEVQLAADAFDAVIERLAAEHGFVADPRHVTLGGTCRRCARARRR